MKKEIVKKVLNIIVTVITSILTTLGTTSCVVDIKPPNPTQVVPIYAQ
ncbi:MAG: smalltalk protein [Bacteroidales bacterium]|nr:smalltalk protein [Bacteroidales bacterium]